MPKPEFQILVCCNERPPDATKPSCAPRGGMDVYRRFKDTVRQKGLRDRVMTVRTGCLKHCNQGIAVCIWPHNLWYSQVTVDDVDEIVERFLDDGAAVERLLMPDVPWQ